MSRCFVITVICVAVLSIQLSVAQRGREDVDNEREIPSGPPRPGSGGRPPNPRPAVLPPRRPIGKPIDLPGRGSSTPTPPTRRTTERECSCTATAEYNPVCGTDGVSYTNPGRFNCAKRCGKDISILHYGNCTPTDPNAPTSSTTSTTTPSSTTSRRRG